MILRLLLLLIIVKKHNFDVEFVMKILILNLNLKHIVVANKKWLTHIHHVFKLIFQQK